ncbi:hypothetical protein CKO15_09500 [Halorhodospira abdelmalekii]|uniref:hypothetical protein n=1 Tax=Halorhodospira abdelmalekii TaxID=421629 RepID=UPI0019074F6B|nr:hypothetical protein [Halorhodospira abdelmalekii]MBK1735514.1 hypothetical protein [Halorhodospira abdelmalekii]
MAAEPDGDGIEISVAVGEQTAVGGIEVAVATDGNRAEAAGMRRRAGGVVGVQCPRQPAVAGGEEGASGGGASRDGAVRLRRQRRVRSGWG